VPFYGANRSGSTVSQGLRDAFWWWSMQVGLKGAYDCIEAFSETDLTEDLRRIDVPTLIVHGDDDQIVPIDASARRSVELVSGATLKVYPGAPHGLAQVAPQGPVQHRPARLPEGLNLQRARPGFPGPAQPTRYAARSADRSAPLA
jgi:pimeloyl-ACP methyl ester carboxylesterase